MVKIPCGCCPGIGGPRARFHSSSKLRQAVAMNRSFAFFFLLPSCPPTSFSPFPFHSLPQYLSRHQTIHNIPLVCIFSPPFFFNAVRLYRLFPFYVACVAIRCYT